MVRHGLFRQTQAGHRIQNGRDKLSREEGRESILGEHRCNRNHGAGRFRLFERIVRLAFDCRIKRAAGSPGNAVFVVEIALVR